MTLNEAIALAAKAHEGQVDKLGQPYILHPLRVMQAMETDDERIVAVLHDVVEDTHISLATLRELGLPDGLLAAVDAITRVVGEPYMPDYIERIAGNPIARKVKLADLADNLSVTRSPQDANAPTRRARYRKARSILEAA
jgi:(p)ppGpp synthase/HD superfamily hydrolase